MAKDDQTRIDGQEIAYLAGGTERQKAAYQALAELTIFDILREYTPILVGTIPLDLDVPDSDLDIICEAHDLSAFRRCIEDACSIREGFRIGQKIVNALPTVIANFNYQGFRIEIFGQPRPITQQNAYLHMVAEAGLLDIGGQAARLEIRRLKQAGLKTEPAFASYFNLSGDPYITLLPYAEATEEELRRAVTIRSQIHSRGDRSGQ